MKTIEAILEINVSVDCPGCNSVISLLNETDTNGDVHNDDNVILKECFRFNDHGGEKFECKDVICGYCKTKFNVKGLAW